MFEVLLLVVFVILNCGAADDDFTKNWCNAAAIKTVVMSTVNIKFLFIFISAI
jgi:hypothetical protein